MKFIVGFWFFHCHIDFHAEIGMGIILQVGEISQMPKPPYKFPKCGDWKYTTPVMEEDKCPANKARSLNVQWTLTLIVFVFCVFSQVIDD